MGKDKKKPADQAASAAAEAASASDPGQSPATQVEADISPANGDGQAGTTADHSDFPIIGLGASAGGLKALKEFFERVQPDSGMAYVVILHLSPSHESHVAEILQSATRIPVTQVTRPVRVEPDRVYVIPPTKLLSMADGFIRLTDQQRVRGQHLAIDLYFRTLADTHGKNSACIVLSGTGSDGTNGLMRVKEQGGLTFVQEPGDAEYDTMPRNAIATGLVDFVLPASAIPAKLIEVQQHTSKIVLPPIEPVSAGPRDTDAEVALRDILKFLRQRTGHDFSNYKRATVLRRIERRLQVTQLRDIPSYRDYLRDKAGEAEHLLKDLLISVTNFFRDPDAFQVLQSKILPEIFFNRPEDEQVRAWVAGCATGEEAYSVAIGLLEVAAGNPEPIEIQVFATDIDEAALTVARTGFYPEAIEVDVSPERLARFFERESGGYRVKKEVRDRVLFATHNLLTDPPFSKLDLVTCRNLLIYFNRDLQTQVFELFQFGLRPGGYLYLGSSESADAGADRFSVVDKKHRFYRSNLVARSALHVPPLPLLGSVSPRSGAIGDGSEAEGRRRSFAQLHQQLLERYAPPSVIVNSDYDIVHLSDRAGRFLQFVAGEPSINLLKVVRPELRLEHRTALFQAGKSGISVEARRVNIAREQKRSYVTMIVRPVTDGEPGAHYFLVLFDEVEDTMRAEGDDGIADGEPLVQRLEEELRRTTDQLQLTVEQYETQTEELKASNEELQAMNEEMRSTTEELETSKEELQSVNEELTTVNHELRDRLDEVAAARDDLHNLIASSDIATVFLDRDLRIQLYTPRALDLFNLIPSDRGRPLADITHKLEDGGLLEDAAETLRTLQKIEREIRSRAGRVYLLQVTPYRKAVNTIGGVILSFVDLTARKFAQAKLEVSNERLRLMVEAVTDYAILTLDPAGTVDYWNAGAERMFGFTEAEILGRSAAVIFTPEDRERGVPEQEMRTAREVGRAIDERWHLRKDKSRFFVSGVMVRLDGNIPGEPSGYAKIARDLTERVSSEETLRRSEERFRALVDKGSDVITVTDRDGRITYASPSVERVCGYAASEFIGRIPLRDLNHPDDLEHSQKIFQSILAQPGGSVNLRYRCRHKDGSWRWIESTLTNFLDDPAVNGVVANFRDVSARIQAEEELKQSHAELEQKIAERTAALSEMNAVLQEEVRERHKIEEERIRLLHRIIGAQEEERRRIARDMHDQFGQQLTALKLQLAALKEKFGGQTDLGKQLGVVETITEQLDADVDFLTMELRPSALDDLGLSAALTSYVQNWSLHFNVPAEIHISGIELARLGSEVETVLYRITQEALNNVAKYALAKKVNVMLERHAALVSLIIEDDGVGFEVEKAFGPNDKGLGLIGMRERAALVGGTFELESQLNQATTVFVRIPVTPAPETGEND